MSGKIIPIESPAKVNLRLKIEGVRSDGYHLLSMLNVMVDFCDVIEAELTGGGALSVSVAEDDLAPHIRNSFDSRELCRMLSDPEANLAARAASAFFSRFSIASGLNLRIKKNIPPGSGLAGGSSNAASVLKFLERNFAEELRLKSGISPPELRREVLKIAVATGADVPFFFSGGFAVVRGIGDQMLELDPHIIAGIPVLIVIPPVFVSTAEIFKKTREIYSGKNKKDLLLEDFAESTGSIGENEIESRLTGLVENDLEVHAAEYAGEIGKIISAMRTFPELKVSLSGSGCAVFAIGKKQDSFTPGLISSLESVLRPFNVFIRQARAKHMKLNP